MDERVCSSFSVIREKEIDGVKEAVSGKGVGYGGDEF